MATDQITTIRSVASTAATGIFSKAARATAQVLEPDRSPTDGQSIPIVLGAVKLNGSVIWIRTFLNSKNECRAHVAVCFGRNAFGRPLSLMALTQSSNYIYRRTSGAVVDPPSAVRFYDGTHGSADPLISSYEGASNTPAFKGYIYAVLENVKVGDFGAEFTDAGEESIVSTSGNQSCDETLQGINLVYHPETGLYYGVEFPKTNNSSNIVTSDGCRVLARQPVVNFNQDKPDDAAHNYEVSTTFYVDSTLMPVRCTKYVAVNVIAFLRAAVPNDGSFLIPGVTHVAIIDPVTGSIQSAAYNWIAPDPYSYFSQFATGSIIPEDHPMGPDFAFGVDWVDSYLLPGYSSRQFVLVRKYDRGLAGVQPFPTVDLGAENNIAAVIFDFSRYWQVGSGFDWCYGFFTGNTFSSDTQYYYSGEIRSVSKLHGTEWGFYDGPAVDDFLWLQNHDTFGAEIGAVRTIGETTEVFRLYHSSYGVNVTVQVELDLPDGFAVSGINYDSGGDRVLVSAGPTGVSALSSRLYKIGAGGSVSYVNTGSSGLQLLGNRTGVVSNNLAPMADADGSMFVALDIDTGEPTVLYDSSPLGDTAVLDLEKNKIYLPGVSGYTVYSVGQISPGQIGLVDVLSDCCAIKGYDPGELYFENLDSEYMKGLLISSTIRLTDLFRRLGALYSFTFAETDRKLKFLKKRTGSGFSIDVTLQKNDLLLAGAEDSFVRVVQRNGASNLLGGMDLEFINPSKNYETSTIKIRRPTGFDTGASERIETLSVPVTIDVSYAYQLMYESFYETLQKQTKVAFGVPSWSAAIEPGDCIAVDVDGIVTTGIAMRVVTREDFAQDIEMDVFLEDGSTSLSEVVDYFPEEIVDAITPSYIHLDLPFLRASDYVGPSYSFLYHGIAAAEAGSWSWADLYRSRDSINFVKLLDYDLQPMLSGRALNALAPPTLQFALDEANTLVVEIVSGEPSDLASISYLDQINGANLCALWSRDGWEVLSFQSVTENSDGSLTLSGLQRGLFGSHLSLNHAVGDTLVYLDPLKIVGTEYTISDTGRAEQFAIKTPGIDLSQAGAQSYVFGNKAMTSVQPAALVATHQAGSNDLVIIWEHVTCVPCQWSDAGVSGVMHADITYEVVIETESGLIFEFTTTDRTYTWTQYGAELGATALAEEEIASVTVTPFNEAIGYGNAAVTTASETL